MKVLFIGGTGTISTSISRKLIREGHELWLLNRGSRNDIFPEGLVNYITCDINNEADATKKLEGMSFDVVCDFIGFVKPQLERDYRLFKGKTKQFMYISSASAYQKPLAEPYIDEATPLCNPYWGYSRNKIECEEYLMELYRKEGFPITIVRPSHTYCERSVPIGVHGNGGAWQVVKCMLEGKPVIIHGDGTSLWTLTHADDFAKGFVGLMGNVHAIGQAYQITSDESLTWTQIHKIIADTLGVEFKPYYVPSDFLAAVSNYDFEGGLIGDKSNSVIFDNSKLKRAVPDYCATIRFDQGAKQALDYMLTHPECQTPDPEFDEWCDRVIDALENAKKEILK